MADEPDIPPSDDSEPNNRPSEEPRSWFRRWWVSLSQNNKIAVAIPIVCALIAGFVALTAAILPQIITALSHDDALELVDATVLDFEPDEKASIVDIKVRSRAEQVAFAKRADIVIRDARQLKFCPSPSPQGITYSYDVALPALPDNLPLTVSKQISQALKPNESDRFVLKLGTEGFGADTIGATVYLFTVRIYYNEGEDTYVESRPLLAYVQYPSQPLGMTVIDSPKFRDCIGTNAASLQHLTGQDAFRSEGLSNLADEYKEAAANLR